MIIIKNLFFTYFQKPVLADVNLLYEPGKIYYLLGPNGFGKSTLLRCIAGLQYPKQGSIMVNNYNPFKRDVNFLNDISCVNEESYYPDMQIGKFVDLYGALYPDFSIESFHNYLKMFNVVMKGRLSSLSFGQRKKVYLAFAFASNTKIILLDEPTNGLDVNSKMQFRKILSTLAARDKIIIIATHDVSDADVLADGITVLGPHTSTFSQSTDTILSVLPGMKKKLPKHCIMNRLTRVLTF